MSVVCVFSNVDLLIVERISQRREYQRFEEVLTRNPEHGRRTLHVRRIRPVVGLLLKTLP